MALHAEVPLPPLLRLMKYTKTTRRAQFLAEMNRVVPWRTLCARIEPVYPKAGNGRPPVGVERMLRMYFLQHWFNLSDPAVEEALYDSPTLRAFVGIDLGQEPVPDETTVCKFRHLLEEQGLGQVLLDEVTQQLRAQGLAVSTGTIVDATIIAAPSSTKNATGTRDPGMRVGQRGLRSLHRHLPWWLAARLITARHAHPRKTYSEIP
jgi:IS5 family transposase